MLLDADSEADNTQHSQQQQEHQLISPEQLEQHVRLIQRAWRDTLAIRAAQQQLLCRALLKLEQEVISTNAAVARLESRTHASTAASAASRRDGTQPTQKKDDQSAEVAMEAEVVAAPASEAPAPAPPAAATHAASLLPRNTIPWRSGGPLLMPDDFFLGDEEEEEEQEEKETRRRASDDGMGGGRCWFVIVVVGVAALVPDLDLVRRGCCCVAGCIITVLLY